VYHNTAAVGTTENPKYADLYFMDAAQASSYRANVEANGGCCRDLMEELDEMLRENNPYAAIYKKMRQVLEKEYLKAEAENRPHQFVGMFISSDRKNLDQRRYNSSTTDDIAIISKSVNVEQPVDRDIRGHLLIPSRGRKFIQINPQKPMCDPMTYPPDRNFCPKAGPKPCGWCGGHRGISKRSHCEPLFEYVTHFSSCRIRHFLLPLV
jgi:hypothetical protein